MEYDFNNDMFRLAAELVNQSNRNIFLTGKAGTGKTTFLKYIRENCLKQIAVVAPTGVAAINAGGVTIHSFFQLPISPFIPDIKGFTKDGEAVVNKNSLLSKLRMTREKKKVLQELELLIIDEISMVRCDTLDAIDTVLRHIRKRYHERFGGVQVLFIGDMFQLPPVIKEQEWSFLKDYYNSQYFFDSNALKEEPPVYIEFDKIYRQNEENFIRVLNQIRNNDLDEEARGLLEKCYSPNYIRKKNDGYIILTTHNEKARIKNESELNRLDAPLFVYEAEIDADFPENNFPAEEILKLKIGAQVMFIKNDTDRIKRYFNGKIGTVTELNGDKILVHCEGDSEPIDVKKEKWENIRYSVDKTSRQLNEEVLGSFTQYPLRLAWAITIHKSQGLTFNKVIIDAGDAFAPGQVYVALSRCTSLDGIILQSKIRGSNVFTDPRIVSFAKKGISKDFIDKELENAKKNYLLKILIDLFDYKRIIADTKEVKEYIIENNSSFNKDGDGWVTEFLQLLENLQITAEKFQKQLSTISKKEPKGEEGDGALLQERVNAGARYFINEQESLIIKLLNCKIVTDSRTHAKEINDLIKEIFATLSLKRELLESASEKFGLAGYYQRRRNFIVPSITINVYAGVAQSQTEVSNTTLYHQLRKLRDEICAKADLPIYMVAGSTTLEEMAKYLPQDLIELREISGFGDTKIKKYGQQFINVILEYCSQRNLSSRISEKESKRARKSSEEKKNKVDTKAETFRLFKSGKKIREIATERNLTNQTIEGHLAYYVAKGEIDILELISRDKLEIIEPEVKSFSGGSITPIKNKLGEQISFGDIKLVIGWMNHQKNQRPI